MLILLMFLGLIALGRNDCIGTNYNVSENSNPTIEEVMLLIKPGDSVFFNGIFNKTLSVNKSGTGDLPIHFIGTGAKILVTEKYGINITGNFVTVSGFEVLGANSFGIISSGKNVVISDNIVHDNVLENGGNNLCLGTSWGSGIKIMVGGESSVIKNNLVYENCGEGIAVTRGVGVSIDSNVVRDNYSVNIYIDNSPFTNAVRNKISCTGKYLRNGRRMTGVAIAEETYSGWGAQRHDNQVLSNIIDGCYQGIASWVPEVVGGKFINGLIEKNIITNGQNGSIVVNSENQNVIIRNNNIYTPLRIDNMAGVTVSNNGIGVTWEGDIVGDFNGDGKVDLVDFGFWKDKYLLGQMTLVEFGVWKREYLK